jgi:hypothetical protein
VADGKVRQFTDLFSARSGSDSKSQRRGRLDAPGTSTFELAKGPARIYYTEMIGGGEDDAARFDAPEDLKLAVTDANGAELPIQEPVADISIGERQALSRVPRARRGSECRFVHRDRHHDVGAAARPVRQPGVTGDRPRVRP